MSGRLSVPVQLNINAYADAYAYAAAAYVTSLIQIHVMNLPGLRFFWIWLVIGFYF